MTVKPGSTLRRFGGYDAEPERSIGLSPAHPAVVEGRTIFPSTVVAPASSPRLLVSGINNPKLGKRVTKGERAGWPIYQLTLEERATCPKACAQYLGCYGNSMHRARRHRVDNDLTTVLAKEIDVLALLHPDGFLIRLHTLGDFFSTAYVDFWRRALNAYPALHVWGYTARDEDDPIGREVLKLASERWDRFAIRLSGVDTQVIDEAPEDTRIIVCPAQTSKTECCGSCGLCWAEAARPKVIGFLRHGMKGARRGDS